MESEILTDEELAEITGYTSRGWQRKWLIANGWTFVESKGRRPLVGRLHARAKLGVSPFEPAPCPPTKVWTPDFSRINA